MQTLFTSLRSLRYLSLRTRFVVFLLSFLFCLAIFSPIIIYKHIVGGAPIFVLSISMAAWLFKPRVAFICCICTVLCLVIINSVVEGTLFWSESITLYFLSSTFAFIVSVSFVSVLRHAIEVADSAQRQSQMAATQIARAYDTQHHLNELKDQFLLNVSHELRTPLTEVKGYVELLSEHHGHLDNETRTTFIGSALQGCEELQLLISNVLDAAQLEDSIQLLKKEELHVATIMQEMSEYAASQAHSLSFDIPPEITVWADQQQLRRVLRNLLSNAFKYSPVQTPVIVSARPIIEGGQEYICISVQDAGPGIAPRNTPLLFQKFSRLERDVTGHIRGSGLGLYLSRQFVEGMGGNIWVESTGIPGQGSRFRFTLPCATTSTDEAPLRTTIQLDPNASRSYSYLAQSTHTV